MEMPLICWIGLIWIASSSSSAAPMTTNRRSLIGGLSDAKFALMPKPLETSRAPAITTKASESYSTTRSATLEGPAFVTKADPISAGTKPLPEKSLSSQSSTLTTPASSHITGSQSNSLHIPKDNAGSSIRQPEAQLHASSRSQEAANELPDLPNSEPPDKLKRFGFSGRFIDLLNRKKSSPSLWQKFKTMKSNSLTIVHFFKAILRRLKDYSPRRYSSEEPVAETVRNARKAPSTPKPPPPPESMKGVKGEAKVTKGNAETKDLTHKVEGEKNLASEKEKNSASKTEQTDLPASSWWDLVNVPSNALYSLVDTVKSRLPQSLQSSPAPEHLLGEVTKPSTGNALVTTKVHELPAQSSDQKNNLASANDKNLAHQAEQDHAPRLSWYQMMDVPRNVYKSLADRVKPSPPHGHAPSPASTPPSQTLVQVTDPSASKAASTAPEVASDSQQTKQQSSVVKHGDPAKTTAPDEEPPLTVELKKEVARAQLEGLINGILQPIVSKYLTPDKTGRMTDKWLRKKNAVLRWAAKWVPDKYSHNFIREKIAPSFVKGFSNWVSKTIMKVSPESMFEILERNSIEFLATVNKAHGEHPPPTP
ncbi:hypothetical protein Pst134EA_000749 [Puccinia striiformis f. sp. tritici]|uniref:RxLR-like protein n=3 Tax=Puccinia striiformis TaxID=27350 RepID=A0A0L0URM7_9BASI|nr:hypothetical protein Pst134EA_000749 [Puccinia striiformis f. sp. tritici]KAI9601773.1 hypothetical protein KEM48_001058 [Puccinia striiformis f. sp. tritici PST-130]KNE89742.1 hypothetical protein PSTG_16811 [Puccinia striiformis f. sp. tritici PST-78]KAH9466906.1 hypothetical protein Pst134EB_001948 [Puccinia striiformis f. sp. tritici]KAH9473669.1 hypothetical protein Pst134EA_000749 [Puccinia striiformis f. sp. tritici]KAI9603700.1 hypothetical protein KEM48_000464 [Puccinia striiformis